MKNQNKFLLFVAFLTCLLAVGALLATASDEFVGISFSGDEAYTTAKTPAVSLTLEATVFFPEDFDSSTRGGVIFGNYPTAGGLNFEIYSNGHPRVYIVDADGTDYNHIFSEVNIYNGEPTHIAVTIELVNNRISLYCYINGELADSHLNWSGPSELTFNGSFGLGRDMRGGEGQYFRGQLSSLVLYEDIRTADEIKTDYATPGVDDPMLFYDFSDGVKSSVAIDKSGNGHDAVRTARWFTEKEPVEDYSYSMAVVGDTQIISYYAQENFDKIYDYILDNVESKNIQFVMGLGDITEKNEEQEWIYDMAQIRRMDGKVPYSLVRGNHDGKTLFNKYVPYEDYKGSISGAYEIGNMLNTYYTFSVGDIQYMVMCLDYGAADGVLNWASEVIEAHPYHNVIITTHAYLYRDGTTLDENDVCPPKGTGGYNNGDHMWDKLIKNHENIVLVLSGHDPCENIVMTQTEGDNGNIVTQMLIDPQGVDDAYKSEGCTGMVAMFYFSENGKTVQVEYYSTIREQYLLDTNQFTFELDVVSVPEEAAGMDFTASPIYKTEQDLANLPLTYEADVYFPADFSARGGVIIGNYEAAGVSCVSFEVAAGGAPRLYIQNGSTKYDYKFENVNLYNGKYTNIAVTYDPDAKTVSCYIDGVLKQTLDANIPTDITFGDPLALGGDLRSGNAQYFKGRIKNVVLYADIRTAEEIAVDAVTPGTGDPMAYYDLSVFYEGASVLNNIPDQSGNGLTMKNGYRDDVDSFECTISGACVRVEYDTSNNTMTFINTATGWNVLTPIYKSDDGTIRDTSVYDFMLRYKNVCEHIEIKKFGSIYQQWDSAFFSGFSKLQTVHFAEGQRIFIQSGYGYMFNGCSELTTVWFGGDENKIDGCVNFTGIENYQHNNNILVRGFTGCTNIKSVIIPEDYGFNKISQSAFSGCTNLESIKLPATVASINANAFENCTALKNIIIENTSVTVDPTAFNGASTVIFCHDSAQVKAINDSLAGGETEAEAFKFGSISAEGIAIRTEKYNGLRYIYSFDNIGKAAMEKAGYTLREYGLLVSSAANMASAVISKSESGEYVSGDKISQIAVYNSEKGGICAKILSISTDETTYFAGTVTNFSEVNAFYDVYVRAYSVYVDADGNDYISYADYGDVDEEYKTSNLFKVTYDMYANADSGIRDESVDTAAVWSTLLLGADIAEYKETALESFEGVTLTLVNNGEGEYLAFVKSATEASEEVMNAAKSLLANSGYIILDYIDMIIK